MLEIEGIRHRYGGQTVLDVPHLALEQGEHMAVLGLSGSGKTTLLHILAGLLRPSEGTVYVAHQKLADLSGHAMDRFRGRFIGVVFQQLHLLPALTVEQNVLLAPYLAGLPQRREHARAVLRGLDLEARRRDYPHALSYGQQQRVAIARAVMNEPRVLLADEPTSALDDVRCEQVLSLLLKVARRYEATLVVATHDERVKARIARHYHLDMPTAQPSTP